jgi:hypothetical protein
MDVVLLDQAGQEERRIVVQRVDAADRLTAHVQAASLDRLLAAGQSPDCSAVLTLRARELLNPRIRRRMARSLRRLQRRYTPRPHAALAPVALLPAHVLSAGLALRQLADRLDGDEPVDVRGVALTRLLISEGGGSPHYLSRAYNVVRAAGEAMEALKPA